MIKQKKLIVSHAPFIHNGSKISIKNYNIMLAALPALLAGIYYYGIQALGVIGLSISFSVFWELTFNIITKNENKIGDGSSAVIGIIFAMMLPATAPWWMILTGTFVAIIIGREIFGGIGSNPFNPAVVGIAIIALSWKECFDFNQALINFDMDFNMFYPLAALKSFGASSVNSFSVFDLMIGKQAGAIGAVFGIGIIIGGLYLIAKGIIRWEICFSFIAGIFLTSMTFAMFAPATYAGPFFHLFTGYTLLGIFFLSTEDSSSPVNKIPMILYGLGCGILTILIRNIGVYADGILYAILIMNIMNPLIDKIKPKAFGRV
jgi:electron transport complex protein RnfD